jgi:heme/copper-type cytochrome/quinol oxidase subunit 2
MALAVLAVTRMNILMRMHAAMNTRTSMIITVTTIIMHTITITVMFITVTMMMVTIMARAPHARMRRD